jgi:hypothetical protein
VHDDLRPRTAGEWLEKVLEPLAGTLAQARYPGMAVDRPGSRSREALEEAANARVHR